MKKEKDKERRAEGLKVTKETTLLSPGENHLVRRKHYHNECFYMGQNKEYDFTE